MKTKVSIIIVGLVLLGIGIMIGLVLGIGKREVVIQELPEPLVRPLTVQAEKKVMALLRSAVLDGVCVNLRGKVAEVGEDTIVVARYQDLLELKVGQDASIARWLDPEAEAGIEIELAEIQKGEQIIIYAVIREQGELIAQSITLF